MIAVVDYGMGNLRSVAKALETAGAVVEVTDEADKIKEAAAVVLPGVGAFEEAIQGLKQRGLIQPIVQSIQEGKPFLGICLGLHLLFTESEEGGHHKGLEILKGKVKRFSQRVKIPHIGWNRVKKCAPAGQLSAVLKEVPDESYFYFDHSYYVEPEDETIVATTTEYGVRFASTVVQGDIFACQYHPEKSQRLGLKLLRGFIEASKCK